MKNFLFKLAAGFVMPAFVTTTLFSINVEKDFTVTPKKLERPYVIDVVNFSGKQLKEISGVSSGSDYLSVSNDLNIKVYDEDKISAFPDIRMGIGGKITIYRAPDYLVKDGRKNLVLRSWKKTVGDFLKEKNIEIGLDDKINFSPDTKLEPGMSITIIRVAKTKVITEEDISFNTKKIEDNTLDQGRTKIKQTGEEGIKQLIYQVVREDGEEVSKKLVETKITKEPVDKIVIVGTKPVITGWCKYNDLVLDAALKNGVDPNALCYRMKAESWGNPYSDGGKYKGLFQYEEGFWNSVSAKAGYSGASIWDAKAQIYVTAWAWANGYRGRWPSP